MKEIEELVNKLNDLRKKYYNDSSNVNDEEFDYYENKLRQLDPTNSYFEQVGAKINKDDEEVEHIIPMLSMQKVQTAEDAVKWFNSLAFKFGCVWIDPKLDGISGKLVYDKDGNFQYASTRGDGFVGAKIRFADSINIPKKFLPNSELRGEFIIKKKWQNRFKTSLRNMCSGILKRKEPSEDLKYLSFVIYDVHTYDKPFEFSTRGNKIERIRDELIKCGNAEFDIIPIEKTSDVKAMYEKYVNELRDKWEWETDGIIMTVNGDQSTYDMINSRYKITTFNRYNMAVKPPANFAESEITDIKIKVNRQKVSFVAELKPVQLLNVVVHNATLDNYTNMVINKIGIGTTVLVKRTNDVIPKVYNFYNNPSKNIKYLDITHCPSCGSKLIHVYQDVMCPNEFRCPAIYESKISYIINKFEILGIGDSLIHEISRALMVHHEPENNTLFDFFANFIPLSNGSYRFESVIEDIFNGGVRPKKFKETMFDFFNNKLTESRLLGCFNIPHIGETSLAEHNIRTLKQMEDYVNDLESKPLLESVFDSTLFNWWKKNSIGRNDMKMCIDLLRPFFKTEEEISSDTHLYCISGEVPDQYGNKNIFAAAISEIDSKYKYVKDVTTATEYLVTNETNTSKVVKANKYGVKIVGFDEFVRICKQ